MTARSAGTRTRKRRAVIAAEGQSEGNSTKARQPAQPHSTRPNGGRALIRQPAQRCEQAARSPSTGERSGECRRARGEAGSPDRQAGPSGGPSVAIVRAPRLRFDHLLPSSLWSPGGWRLQPHPDTPPTVPRSESPWSASLRPSLRRCECPVPVAASQWGPTGAGTSGLLRPLTSVKLSVPV